jgi:nitroreductase
MNNQIISEAIVRSQQCQRNWDLTKEVPKDDMELLITAATQCPSKQNVAHYNLHVITDRSIIEQIHTHTMGFSLSIGGSDKTQTNSQVLANILFLFEDRDLRNLKNVTDIYSNEQTYNLFKNSDEISQNILTRDKNMAVGVASGYVNLTASLLGYATGFCACFDCLPIKELLGLANEPLLLIGIGYKNHNLNRQVHHLDHSFVYPSKAKQTIKVKYY